MKHRIVATCTAALALALSTTFIARAATSEPERYIPIAVPSMSVTGQASSTRVPDRATVVFQIETTSDVAAKASSDNANIANRLFNAVIALNIPRGAISTGRFTIQTRPRPPKVDPTDTTLYGVTVTREQRVTVDAVDKVGAVVDAGIDAGAKSVESVSFSLRDPHAAMRDLLAEATADAMAQANTLASAAHVRLVRILSITPNGVPFAQPQITADTYSVLRSASRAIATTVDPGQIDLRASVRIEYQLAP